MKYLITYSKGDLSRQLSLRDTFDSLAQACGGSIRYNEAALVEVDDPLLGEALERICRAVGVPCEIPGNGCAPQRIAEAPEPVSASVSVETPSSDPEHPAAAEPDGSSASLPVCPYCHEPFEPKTKRRKICGKPECQRAYNREYQARLYAAKKAQDEAPDTGKAGTPVSPQDPFEIVSEEFVWYNPANNTYLEMTGLLEVLENNRLPAGTILRRRDSMIPWEVYTDPATGEARVREVAGRA